MRMDATWGLEQDREFVWEKLAREMGGRYFKGDFWEAEHVDLKIGGRFVRLDLCSLEAPGGVQLACTRLRTALFPNPDGMRFLLASSSVFANADTLVPLTGIRAVDSGHPRLLQQVLLGKTVLDTQFRLRTNTLQVLQLFADTRYDICYSLEQEPMCALELASGDENGLSASGSRLTLIVAAAVADHDRLIGLCELIGETMEWLFRGQSV